MTSEHRPSLSSQQYVIQVRDGLRNYPVEAIEKALSQIEGAFVSRTPIWTIGNGGSALVAQHCATDWSKNVWEVTGQAANARALIADAASVSAWGNDLGFEEIFANQIKALGSLGDLAVFFSGSGTSPNILRGAEVASELGLKVITFSRTSAHELHKWADVSVGIPTDSSQVVNDLAHVFCHIVMFQLQTKYA